MKALSSRLPALAWFIECAPILRVVRLHLRHGAGHVGEVIIGVGLLTALAGLGLSVFLVAPTAGWGGALTLFGGGLVAAFGSLTLLSVAGVAVLQNQPANAVLVPRLNRLLRRTVILVWAVALAGGAVLGTAIPHGALAPLAVHLFLLLGLAGRMPGALAFAVLLPLPWLLGAEALLAFLERPMVLALCWTAALLLGWRCLATILPQGGERHYAAIERARAADRATRSMNGWVRGEHARASRNPLHARLLARAVGHGREGELMLHVFGPACQPSSYLRHWLLYGGLSVLAKLAVLAWWPQHHASAAHFVIMAALGGMASLAMVAPFRFANAFGVTAGEQALYRLAPGAPPVSQLNRRLAGHLLRACLFAWAGSLLVLLGITVLWDGSPRHLMGAWSAMCGALVFAAWPLRDQAHHPGMASAVWVLLFVLASLVGAVAFLSIGQWWVWAVLLAAALLFVGWRYRAMLRSPPAFPARRLPVQ